MVLKDFTPLFFLLFPLVTSQPLSEGRDPTITKFHVTSKIQLRYASTEVLSHMRNPSSQPQEVTFEIRLPEKAFIHGFSMTVDGEEHVATVEAKAEARETYDSARKVGLDPGFTICSRWGLVLASSVGTPRTPLSSQLPPTCLASRRWSSS
jgi:hypothetical protein